MIACCAGAAGSLPISRLLGMRELAFVRSPVAHARLRGFEIPDAVRHAVFTWADLAQDGVKPIRAASGLPRLQGIRAAAARDRQGALRRRADRHLRRRQPRRSRRHRRAGQRRFRRAAGERRHARGLRARRIPRCTSNGAITSFWKPSSDAIRRRCRGRADQGDTRHPHRAPMHVAAGGQGRRRVLGPPDRTAGDLDRDPDAAHRAHRACPSASAWTQARIRVIAPDVGGGFGYKGILLAEEVCLGWLAMRMRPSGALDRGPARASDRRRQLPRAPLPRSPPMPTATARCCGIDCEAIVDSGAYSAYPFSACLEAAQVGEHPARTLRLSVLPLPHLFGRDQQMRRSCPIAASREPASASRWS